MGGREAGLAYRNAFDRIALVGDKRWEEWMTQLSKPFVDADVRYFDEQGAPGAVGWLLETRSR